MGDVFKEQLVKRNKNNKDSMKKAVITSTAIVLSAASVLFFIYTGAGIGGAAVVIFIIFMISFYLINNMNVEYEYIYTNGELDIDCIYNKTKRKTLFTAEVKDFEIMAHIDDKSNLAPFENYPVKDFSSGDLLGNTYVFVASLNGKNYRFIIEPNDEMLNSMSVYLTPRKLFRKK